MGDNKNRTEEELDYISSSPLIETENEPVKTQDELDLPTLKAVCLTLEAQIKFYDSVDSLDVGNKNFTVKQQLAVNKRVKLNLEQALTMVQSTIENIKEKYEQ